MTCRTKLGTLILASALLCSTTFAEHHAVAYPEFLRDPVYTREAVNLAQQELKS